MNCESGPCELEDPCDEGCENNADGSGHQCISEFEFLPAYRLGLFANVSSNIPIFKSYTIKQSRQKVGA